MQCATLLALATGEVWVYNEVTPYTAMRRPCGHGPALSAPDSLPRARPRQLRAQWLRREET